MPAASLFKQLAGFSFRILRIVTLDHHEKPVMRDERETFVLQQWMIKARQTIQEQHAKQRAKSAKQNRQFVGRRESRVRAEHRFAPDNDWIVEGVHPPNH